MAAIQSVAVEAEGGDGGTTAATAGAIASSTLAIVPSLGTTEAANATGIGETEGIGTETETATGAMPFAVDALPLPCGEGPPLVGIFATLETHPLGLTSTGPGGVPGTARFLLDLPTRILHLSPPSAPALAAADEAVVAAASGTEGAAEGVSPTTTETGTANAAAPKIAPGAVTRATTVIV